MYGMQKQGTDTQIKVWYFLKCKYVWYESWHRHTIVHTRTHTQSIQKVPSSES